MEPVEESGFGYITVQGRCCRNLQLTLLCSFVAGEAIARIIPHRPVHSGTKMASLPSVCAKKPTFVRSGPVFAECQVFDNRQRRHVCRVSQS